MITIRRFLIPFFLSCFTCSLTHAQPNTLLGFKTGESNLAGALNVMVGAHAGEQNEGSGNIFIGAFAGRNEMGDNKLYIGNNEDNPVIYGELEYNRIAIGTQELPADTTYKLAVEGRIITREVKVTQVTPWPDFVFYADYILPDLYALEQYVKAKHHLPGIPTAAEVEQEGLLIGDLQSRLLQKIEELTLYTIEQQKQIDALIQRVLELEQGQ